MNAKPGVTLQISLAPTDLPTAKHTVPHQLRVWADQVDEILLVLDKHRSHGRYSTAWHERLPGMLALLDECCATYPHARVVEVDYSPEAAARLADRYFGGQALPPKDCNGGPFYSLFYGLDAPRYNHVLHTDSDMMFGGGSPRWVAEAIELMNKRSDVMVCCPLYGPPAPDGRLTGHVSHVMQPVPHTLAAYQAKYMSWRLFLLDRERFQSEIGRLRLIRPGQTECASSIGPIRLEGFWHGLFWRTKARADGNPPFEFAEVCLTDAMRERGLYRVDLLGSGSGMWSLHPPHRSALFYQRLPELIDAVERGNIPDGQLGDYDINDSMIDWSSARRTVWQQARNQIILVVRNVARADEDRPSLLWRLLKGRDRLRLDRA